MDYKGQQLCEYIYSILVVLFGAVAWVVGYIHGDFSLTFKGWAAGTVLSLLLCIPDWPFFNRNKVEWLDEIGGSRAGSKDKAKTKQAKRKATKSSS